MDMKLFLIEHIGKIALTIKKLYLSNFLKD